MAIVVQSFPRFYMVSNHFGPHGEYFPHANLNYEENVGKNLKSSMTAPRDGYQYKFFEK